MRAKYIVYWLVGFVVIAAVVYWFSNNLLQQPVAKPPIIHLPSEQQTPIANETVLPERIAGFETTRPGEPEIGTAKTAVENEVAGKQPNAGVESSAKATLEPTQPLMNIDSTLAEELSEQEQKREKLNQIRDELKEMVSEDPKNIDFAKLDKLLSELESMGDANGILAGVSISQLRKVVAQSNKIMQTSQSQGLAPGEDKNQKLKEEVKTLQELQKGIVVGQ